MATCGTGAFDVHRIAAKVFFRHWAETCLHRRFGEGSWQPWVAPARHFGSHWKEATGWGGGIPVVLGTQVEIRA